MGWLYLYNCVKETTFQSLFRALAERLPKLSSMVPVAGLAVLCLAGLRCAPARTHFEGLGRIMVPVVRFELTLEGF